MDDTPNLDLPYLMAAQAQKHVTHNEALTILDAIVQLSVLDRNLTSPPGSPAEGDRYLVASGATGDWAGEDDAIAAYQDGAWIFYAPKEGWMCWVGDEDALLGWNGSSWVSAGGGGGGVNPASLVGVNATADSTNRLSVSSPASLFSHEGDDHQVKINKAAAGDTASVLFQNGFSGRAEFGLTGDDDFHMKVSADGSTFHEGIVLDKSNGRVSFPNTPLGLKNYLINGDGGLNQRAFAGGSLAAGDYGYDRWKADTGGASVSVSGGTWTLTSGTIVQVIESPGLAGETVTVSVEDLTGGDLDIDIEGETGTISAASGRSKASVTVPGGSTGNITLKLSPSSGAVTFKRVQLERGSLATAFEYRHQVMEMAMAQRYFWRRASDYSTYTGFMMCVVQLTNRVIGNSPFCVPMRAQPTIAVNNLEAFDGVNLKPVSAIVYDRSSKTMLEVGLTTSSGLTVGNPAHVRGANTTDAYIEADAEL